MAAPPRSPHYLRMPLPNYRSAVRSRNQQARIGGPSARPVSSEKLHLQAALDQDRLRELGTLLAVGPAATDSLVRQSVRELKSEADFLETSSALVLLAH